MFIEERHQEILNTLKEQGRISIGEIQQQFGVSPDSARRDLRLLEEQGLLKRTHGGALPIAQVRAVPPRNISPREMTDVKDSYLSIAKKAAALVHPNDVVYLTNGSVGYLMTKFLPRDFPYTLVVNAAGLADELRTWENVTLFLTGGQVRPRGSMVDTTAVQFVSGMRFDLCLMTGAGLSAAFGMSNHTHETAVFQRTVMERSRKRVALFPAAKVGFEAFIKVADASAFHMLITDWDAVEDELSHLREIGLEVVQTQPEDVSEHMNKPAKG